MLPAPDATHLATASAFVAPRTGVEEELAADQTKLKSLIQKQEENIKDNETLLQKIKEATEFQEQERRKEEKQRAEHLQEVTNRQAQADQTLLQAKNLRKETIEQAEKRGLTGAISSQQRHSLALFDLQGQSV